MADNHVNVFVYRHDSVESDPGVQVTVVSGAIRFSG